MSLPYSEFPVYIGGVGVSSVPSETAGYVPATQVNVNYNTTHSPKRKLGTTIAASDQFGFSGPLSADISIGCILQSGLVSGLDFLLDANQDNFVTIQIGSGVYNKCYATDVSVSIAPFVPVTLQAKFVSLDPVTGSQITGDSDPFSGGFIPFDSDAIAYGHTCTIRDDAGILNNVQSQVSFNRKYSRTPTHELGSINASTMLLDGVEEELTVTSTGVNSLIDFSGEELANTLSMSVCGVGTSAPFITDFISFPAGSRVLAETFSTNGGETVTTNATIKQIKL